MPFKLCFGFSLRGEWGADVFLLFICSSIVKKVEALESMANKIEEWREEEYIILLFVLPFIGSTLFVALNYKIYFMLTGV
jgi:hypothetical protein